MDKEDLQEIIHEEISGSLNEIARNLRKEKKKPNYLYLVVFSTFMLYVLYIIYKTVNSITI